MLTCSIFFSALQTGFLEAAGSQQTVTRQIWCQALTTALYTLYKCGFSLWVSLVGR